MEISKKIGDMMMKNKQTSFDYLYQVLKSQIIAGSLSYGAKLPSISQTCQIYNVGVRTVRDVLQRLKEEGYIKTEERKAATVAYKKPQNDVAAAKRYVYEHRESLLEICETFARLVPQIIAVSIQSSKTNVQDEWAQIMRYAKNKTVEEIHQAVYVFLCNIMDRSGNLLFRDLFFNISAQSIIPFDDAENKLKLMISLEDFYSVVQFINKSIAGPFYKAEEYIEEIRKLIIASTNSYVDNLSKAFAGEEIKKPINFVWNMRFHSDPFYMQITRDLIDKIGTGHYVDEEFLPKESELAQQYGVCLATIRNAIATLNELGFGQTINAKGTKIIHPTSEINRKIMKNKLYKSKSLLYLSALQLMVIVVRPAAEDAFALIDDKAKRGLKKSIENPDIIPLDSIIKCVIAHQRLAPMKNILQAINKLLTWGFYFAIYKDGPSQDKEFQQKAFWLFQACATQTQKALPMI